MNQEKLLKDAQDPQFWLKLMDEAPKVMLAEIIANHYKTVEQIKANLLETEKRNKEFAALAQNFLKFSQN